MADKADLIQADRGQDAIPIHLVNKDGFPDWVKTLSSGQRAALEAQKFDGSGYQVGIVPDGDDWFAVGGVADPDNLSSWCMAKLAEALPGARYKGVTGTSSKSVLESCTERRGGADLQPVVVAERGHWRPARSPECAGPLPSRR